ncbi:hypothetical protein [Nocardioides sp.]|uniref:hypothetical protein n=1 Tax=Nocardioides sp. TaxID=35761 RepID=UPI002617948E|nr:hypothetical protein [Nocardioides sp.]MDI6911451.1 hypothetical protein [Nocardioides sp.]
MRGNWRAAPDGGVNFVLDPDHEDEVTYEQILSTLVEVRRRSLADPGDRVIGPSNQLADRLAEEIAKILPDVDRELVCRVGLLLLSRAGAMLVEGVPPTTFMNVSAIALAKHAGHVPPGNRVR